MWPVGLTGRLITTVLIALMVVWMVVIANIYRSYNSEKQNVRPSPEKITAIIELVERAGDRQQRMLALNAIRSNVLDLRLEDDFRAASDTASFAEANESLAGDYAMSFGGRVFAVAAVPVTDNIWSLGFLSVRPQTMLEFRVGLRTGGTLVIESKSPFAVSPLGVPVGFGAGLFGTLIALVTLLVLCWETRPLSQLARAVDSMDFAGEPAPLPRMRPGTLEIRALVAAFDRLQIRLSQLLRSRMAMLGGISHDVRTFATRLRLRIDFIPDKGERERAIADISDMIRLLDDALLASRAGAGELAEELLEFDALVSAEVEDRRTLGSRITCRVSANAIGAVVLGDRLSLRRVISNLVDNALKYGLIAHLHLHTDSLKLILVIDDEGPGIPPALRNLLLEPFVRIETSRNRSTGGAGLGLAIVRNLVEAHRGSIGIGEAPGGGARVTVELPLFVAS